MRTRHVRESLSRLRSREGPDHPPPRPTPEAAGAAPRARAPAVRTRRREGASYVELPYALARKYPSARRDRGAMGLPGNENLHGARERRTSPPSPPRTVLERAVQSARRAGGIVKPAGCHQSASCFCDPPHRERLRPPIRAEAPRPQRARNEDGLVHLARIGTFRTRSPLDETI